MGRLKLRLFKIVAGILEFKAFLFGFFWSLFIAHEANVSRFSDANTANNHKESMANYLCSTHLSVMEQPQEGFTARSVPQISM